MNSDGKDNGERPHLKYSGEINTEIEERMTNT
jgi:hypothetical protein